MKNTEKVKPPVSASDEVILQVEQQQQQQTPKPIKRSPETELSSCSYYQAQTPRGGDHISNNPKSPNFPLTPRGGDHISSNNSNKSPNFSLTPRGGDHISNNSKPSSFTLTPRGSQPVRRVSFSSKPKARFAETRQPPPPSPRPIPESEELHEPLIDDNKPSPSSEEDDDDEEEENPWYEDGDEQGVNNRKKRRRNLGFRSIIEWVSFFVILAGLICSLTLNPLKGDTKWGLEIWKWCLMVMVIFCGRLFSGWVIRVLVFLIERNFMLREKVLYFIYGLRKSFQNCAWLALVLLSWTFMFKHDDQKHNKFFRRVFRFLIGVLIGNIIWLIKIVLVKVLASSFHATTFFDRMKESMFHQYILDSLSGPESDPDEILERSVCLRSGLGSKRIGGESRRMGGGDSMRSGGGGSKRIDMEKLRKLSTQNSASAWNVKRLASYVMSYGLTTISRSIDDIGVAESTWSEWEARADAKRIFKNVAKTNPKYIVVDDLLRYLRSEDVQTILPFFEGYETRQIRKSAFRNWVIQVYVERKALAHSLNDTKTAVQQLHKLASAIVSVIIIIVFVLVMGLATSKVLLVVTSQLLLVGFMFQNTCKTIFEAIIFVFVMHPFDAGDRCVIDGVQMVVEEMNILNTVFLRYDNEKIYYPNSVLSTKPISNFYRSPEMGDEVKFTIDVSTSVENVTALKKAIQEYIESNKKHWSPKHFVIVREIENVDKMKMSLYVMHTMNHQKFIDKCVRRSDLVFELKKIFESLGIRYSVLPQEVHLTQGQSSIGRTWMPS